MNTRTTYRKRPVWAFSDGYDLNAEGRTMSRRILARSGERVAVLPRGCDADAIARLRDLACRRYGSAAGIHTDDVGRVQVILRRSGCNASDVLGYMSAASVEQEAAR